MNCEGDTLCIPGLPGHCPYEVREKLVNFDEGFFHDNAMLHPELPYRCSGISADPLPYRLWRDDIVTGCLLLCLLIIIYVFNATRRQLRYQTKDFFSPQKEHIGLFSVKTGIEIRSRLLIYFLLSLMGGLFVFACLQDKFNALPGWFSPHWLLGGYVAGFFLLFLFKRLLGSFINWVFFPKSQQIQWNDSYAYLNTIEGLIFFPLLLTFVYFSIPFDISFWIFLFILLVIKILFTFKSYKIFFRKSYGVLHLFAYLCALEIMPLIALWEILAMVTKNLIVKY